jgi:hypothetical protein
LKRLTLLFILTGAVAMLSAQDTPAPQAPASPQAPAAAQAQPQGGFKRRNEAPAAKGTYQIDAGTHILLSMVNSVSTKQAQPGDRIYLETAFPVLLGNHIVIPQGSWVIGTITEVKRPAQLMRAMMKHSTASRTRSGVPAIRKPT